LAFGGNQPDGSQRLGDDLRPFTPCAPPASRSRTEASGSVTTSAHRATPRRGAAGRRDL